MTVKPQGSPKEGHKGDLGVSPQTGVGSNIKVGARPNRGWGEGGESSDGSRRGDAGGRGAEVTKVLYRQD